MLPWLGQNKSSIVVLGDLILDEYIDGDVKRVSPEAPVPIHHVKKVSYSLGGAANTARNIKLCGGDVSLVGQIGKDSAGKKIKALLVQDKISCDDLIEDLSFRTIKKTRVTSLRQQLLRLDWEVGYSLEKKFQLFILSWLKAKKPSVIVLSDYQKGFLEKNFIQQIIKQSTELKTKTIVDPKLSDFTCYEGCSLITPNLKEAKLALGEEGAYENNPKSLVLKLREKYILKDILLTLGPRGMLYFQSNTSSQMHYQAADHKDVYDVSGAGDTVIAIMALSLSAGVSIKNSIFYANTAAGIAVSKWQTQAITAFELEQALVAKKGSALGAKTFSLKNLEALKKNGKKIIFTNGCFDVLHYGHILYLEKAKKLGDILVVGLNTDDSVKLLKGNNRPINCLQYRKKTLESLRSVDFVIPFSEDTPERLIQEVSPHFLVKGSDYKKEQIVGSKYVESYGGCVKTLDFIKGLSSTSLIEQMRNQNI